MSVVLFIFVFVLKAMYICNTGNFGNETLCLCLCFIDNIFSFKTEDLENKPLSYVSVVVEGM